MHNAVTVTVERESFEEIGQKVRFDPPPGWTVSDKSLNCSSHISTPLPDFY